MKYVIFSLALVIILQHFSACRGQSAIDILTSSAENLVFVGNNTENTTTPASTTTMPVSTTTSPTPAPTGGHWHVNYTGNNQYCILMDASDLELTITYPTNSGNRSTATFKAPANTEVASLSSCGFNLTNTELNETLVLRIPYGNYTFSPLNYFTLLFYFTRDPFITGDKTLDKSQVYKISVNYLYDPDIFKDLDRTKAGQTAHSESNGTLKEFAVLKDRSYQCNSASTVKVDDQVTLKFSGLRTQAFIANNHFDAPEPCPADSQSSDLVPIIIGAVLAAIVLIVLIAYLVGRARMRRTTYESI